MLLFDREVTSPSSLVALEDDRAASAHQAGSSWLTLPAVLVVAATALAIVIDLVDSAAAWSPFAVALSVLVLVTHAALVRRRA
jgi:hypothetical protein